MDYSDGNGSSIPSPVVAVDAERLANVAEAAPDRRRADQRRWSATDVLSQLPALVVLDRLPVAALAVNVGGEIVFANAAFAAMLGYPPDRLPRRFLHLLDDEDVDEQSGFGGLHARAETVVSLAHADGSIVRARMSRSALVRAEDSVGLVVFDDVTEELWERPRRRSCGG